MLGMLGLGWMWKREDGLLEQYGVTMIDRTAIEDIATLVNDLIDMDFFDESQEQAIFEDAVCQVVECVQVKLPKEYQELINQSSHGGQGAQDRRGIDADLAETIVARMMPYVVGKVKLPHLGKTDERRVIACVVEILIHSMRADRVLWQFCKGEHRHPLIVKVFMKGSVARLYDEDERKEVISKLLANIKSIPFVPIPMMESLAESLINWVAGHVDCALSDSYWQKKTDHDDHLEATQLNDVAATRRAAVTSRWRTGTWAEQKPQGGTGRTDGAAGPPDEGGRMAVAESPDSPLDWADAASMLGVPSMHGTQPETSESRHISHYISDNLTIHLRASIEPVNAPHFVDWAVDHFLNLGILEMDKLEEIWANRR